MSKLLNEFELADWFQKSVMTLRRERSANPERHPPYKKIGSSVRYDKEEVQKWLDSRTINRQDDPTASVKAAPAKRGAPTKAERIAKAKHAGK